MIHVREKISLAAFTTFKLGGPAKYFVEVESVSELKEAIAWAKKENAKIFVLAGGSNVIASETGFTGLVIKIAIKKLLVEGTQLIAGAANDMKELVDESIQAGLAGLEWAGGLPGSFGGAIRGNAGAFGGELKDTVKEVVSISLDSGEEKTRNNQECQFVYRGSIYKDLGNEVIVAATLDLKLGDKTELRKIADSRIAYRRERHPMEYPNSGSIFKNTPVEKVPPDQLEQWHEVVKSDPFPVVPTAKIIADANLAGTKVGGAQVSTKHTNYIVNLGGATGEDVFELISLIREKVYQQFGVELEVEPELLGF